MQLMGLSASPIPVAVVAIRAVVNVAAHAAVIGISLRFLMAVRALEHQIVAWIGVAGGAHAIGSAVIGREPGVIEGRSQPAGCVVASGTRRRKSCRRVVRIIGSRVIRLVARIAIRGQAGVVVVHVALSAGNLRVESGQRERRVVVIEARRNPRDGVMAHIALLRET